jgi:hypothetical protein
VFIRDDTLGWRLRPDADDYYAGARYTINSKGLRSPHSEYLKPSGTKRILQIGDSATIGNGLPYEGTSAHIMEEAFKDKVSRFSVQVINAACDGYSPWQEYEFLKSEGLKYDPDIVTLGFVLNDVAGKFGLERFGGEGIGGQLEDAGQHRDFSRYLFYRLVARTPLYIFLRQKYLTMRLGEDIQKGAIRLEELQARDLVFNHNDEVVREAWDLTLSNVGKIGQTCSDSGIPLLLIYIPFTFQFDLPDSMGYPQMVLDDFCGRNDVHFIDCMPIFREEMAVSGSSPGYYFWDAIHPSAEGNRVIAMAVIDYVEKNGLLDEVD